ncbi:MAG: maleylpyruvate isomerase N-terminal domain-containing protein [Acidimicrobiales bacterium]
MDNASLIESVRTEGQTLAVALEDAAADDLVPTCEGWKIADLAVHVGEFCGFWSHVLCEGTGRPKTPFPQPPGGDELGSWVAELAGHLVGELDATPPDTEVWTWFDADHTAGFVSRRCAHELAVHRYDAQSTSRACTPIASDLAEDGIDEVLDVLVTGRDRSGRGTGRTMALQGTDVGASWVVAIEHDRIAVERRQLDGRPPEDTDVVVSGTASDLELTLYRRPTLSPVDVHGDYTVLEEWHREFTF